MSFLIKRQTLYNFSLIIEVETDLQFIVSVLRDQLTEKGHIETYGQCVFVPDSIENSLIIFDMLKQKIEDGEYEPPTRSDYHDHLNEWLEGSVGLSNFQELARNNPKNLATERCGARVREVLSHPHR
jgi:hypothetical protein